MLDGPTGRQTARNLDTEIAYWATVDLRSIFACCSYDTLVVSYCYKVAGCQTQFPFNAIHCDYANGMQRPKPELVASPVAATITQSHTHRHTYTQAACTIVKVSFSPFRLAPFFHAFFLSFLELAIKKGDPAAGSSYRADFLLPVLRRTGHRNEEVSLPSDCSRRHGACLW